MSFGVTRGRCRSQKALMGLINELSVWLDQKVCVACALGLGQHNQPSECRELHSPACCCVCWRDRLYVEVIMPEITRNTAHWWLLSGFAVPRSSGPLHSAKWGLKRRMWHVQDGSASSGGPDVRSRCRGHRGKPHSSICFHPPTGLPTCIHAWLSSHSSSSCDCQTEQPQ